MSGNHPGYFAKVSSFAKVSHAHYIINTFSVPLQIVHHSRANKKVGNKHVDNYYETQFSKNTIFYLAYISKECRLHIFIYILSLYVYPFFLRDYIDTYAHLRILIYAIGILP